MAKVNVPRKKSEFSEAAQSAAAALGGPAEYAKAFRFIVGPGASGNGSVGASRVRTLKGDRLVIVRGIDSSPRPMLGELFPTAGSFHVDLMQADGVTLLRRISGTYTGTDWSPLDLDAVREDMAEEHLTLSGVRYLRSITGLEVRASVSSGA
jgi:hypothetical protein